ncbi:hypothetical protein EJ04DRAFT_511209 [Polyplosphaeria fusca]|uniref:Uncharacterized protein n=1 Tax=Polyplosphaeria fusca TaxID=682080 RepID=A0A9P4R0B8_9PLEO|nr:hypothetical protein EJ04DRAFT_511209 [Polyplosphaeria fusca]
MKYLILSSLLASAAIAAPFAQPKGGHRGQAGAGNQGQDGQDQAGQQAAGAQNGGNANAAANNQGNDQTQNSPQAGTAAQGTPSEADLATAVSNWMADTSMVSNFLNTGAGITNNVAFKQAATVAFNAEVDELTHKAIIDQANGNQPDVIAANSTLVTGGAFQDVVDKLQLMSQQGRAAVENIDLINQNRCVNVLPNIDAYMASTGSASRAVRPQVCDETGVAGGVQGNGPTQPGDAPGTPQAAFDAAQALADGSGNGQVQNTGNAAQTGNGNNTDTQQGANQGGQQAGAQQGANQGQDPTAAQQGANNQGQQAGAQQAGSQQQAGAQQAGSQQQAGAQQGVNQGQDSNDAQQAGVQQGGNQGQQAGAQQAAGSNSRQGQDGQHGH